MSGRPDAYPTAVREYVLEQVCDLDRALQPIVEALHRGEVEGFGVVPVSYSTARGWVDREKQLRDAAIPLEDDSLDAFVTRLWTVAGAELRKLERDSRSKKPLDVKRLNELEAFAARCRRHLNRGQGKDTPQPKVAPGAEGPESLLDRLAREQQPSAAASDLHPTPPNRGSDTAAKQGGQADTSVEERDASPVHVREATQPSVALVRS